MHAGKYLPGLIATLAVLPAHAQQATPTPTPAPTRIPAPTITTIPGVIPERFSIGTPSPAATPAPRPTPAATPTPIATPTARTPVPAATQRAPQPQPTPAPSAPMASPTPVATASAAPVEPQIAASPVPAPVPSQPAQTQSPPWLWALIGAGGTAFAGLAGWLLLRGRKPEAEEPIVDAIVPLAAPPPPVRGPSPARIATPPAPVSVEPFEIAVQPLRIEIGEREVVIELELTIANITASSADAVRLALLALSASPDQDAQLAAFHGSSHLMAPAEPFDLAAGSGARMPVQLAMPRDAMHVVDVGGRPMFVPIVAIDVRWRGGLSIKRFAASFMLGGAGQGGKLAPIWLDRGQPRGPFAASRYRPVGAALSNPAPSHSSP